MTREEAGGAAGSRGFEYQEIAEAYFFLTDYPDFRSELPAEIYIEQLSSDFAFYIRKDKFDREHFFEVKYRSSGSFNISDFRDVFEEFEDIDNNHAEDGNASNYHLVTNLSLDRELESLMKDARKIRQGRVTWGDVCEKSIYKYRGSNQLLDATDYTELSDLSSLVHGLHIHSIQKEHIKTKLNEYIRECNSPGNSRKLTTEVLMEFRKKDSGVISRDNLCQDLGMSLRRNADSARSSTGESAEEIAGELENLAEDFSSPGRVSIGKSMKATELTTKFSNQVLDNDDDFSSAEITASNVLDDTKRLTEVKREEERIENSLQSEIDRLITQSNVDTTSQDEAGDGND